MYKIYAILSFLFHSANFYDPLLMGKQHIKRKKHYVILSFDSCSVFVFFVFFLISHVYFTFCK